ncbi:MAG: nucleotidyltransferase family protein [Pseudomonadota bacterium]
MMNSQRPKRAMVLAAGLGKRMRPITTTTPKPLVEVAGRALIDHGLDRLAAAGIETAVVNVHYLADLIETHLKRRPAPKIIISDERSKLLDTGGGIAKALPHFEDEPFVLMNSDSFWVEGVRPNLQGLVNAWDETRMDILLMLAPTVASVGYPGRGDFLLSPDGRLNRRPERGVAPFVYAGVAILHPRIFADSNTGAFSLNQLLDQAIEAERLFGIRMEGLWFHVGTPDAIAEAEAALLETAA